MLRWPRPVGPVTAASVAGLLLLGAAAAAAVLEGAPGPVWLRGVAALTTAGATWSCGAVALLVGDDVVAPRLRVLLLWLGVTWSVGAAAYLPLPLAVAAPLGGLWTAALAHLVLALPDGVLRDRLARALVVAGYLLTGPLAVLAFQPGWTAATWASALVKPALGVVLLVVLLRRTGDGSVRPAQAPLFVAAVGALAALTVLAGVVPLALGAAPTAPAPLVDVVAGTALALLPLGVVATVARRHLRRSALVDLGERVARARPEELRGVLADALEDPDLVLAFRVDAHGGWADAGGRPVAGPLGDGGVAVGVDGVVPLLGEPDDPVAVLVPGPGARHDPAVLAGVRAVCGLALANAALRADLAARLVDVQTSRARIVRARDLERRRLERDLHDGAQQHLVAALLALGQVAPGGAAGGRPGARPGRTPHQQAVEQAVEHVRSALAATRRVARGLHPAVLDADGLATALGALVESWPRPVRADVDLPGEVPPAVSDVAYYVAAEALTNAAKHAPDASVRLEARREGQRLVVAVTDDGPGGARVVADGGLEGLTDRCAAVGGRLEVRDVPGGGTAVRAELPCAS